MRYTNILCVSVAACLSWPVVWPAAADIIHVPGDYPTIQEAIDAAVDGDEVEVHPGTYNENINFLGKAIRVYSSDGPDVTIIDAQQTGTVVTCDSAEEPDSVLEGFTITGGNAGFGGGMRNINSSPTVTNCTLSGNTATFDGGGMYNELFSSPTVTNCTFSGNTAGDKGGGMYNVAGSPTITTCVFSGNLAFDGGGMCNKVSSPLLTDCTFSGNAATDRGGGMFNTQASNPTVTNCTFSQNTVSNGFGGGMNNWHSSATVINCTFSGNTAPFGGGGMFNLDSSPTVFNCTFSQNTTSYASGGGMHNWFGSNPTVTNCTFSGNSASQSGGGMVSGDTDTVINCTFTGNTAPRGAGLFNGSGTTVINCTFVGNTASSQGGGMLNQGVSAMVINCTFSGNTADFGGGGMYNFQTTPTVTNCVLWNDSPDEIFNVNGGAFVSFSDVQGGYPGAGNIDADPLFVGPDNDDYHLSPGSPCIDAGNNWGVPVDEFDYDGDGVLCELFPVDLDGNPRFNADEADFDPGCGVPVVVDMGAYEYQFDPTDQITFADLNADGSVGAADLLGLLVSWGPCGKGCCLADLDLDGSVGASDLLALLANWGPCP